MNNRLNSMITVSLLLLTRCGVSKDYVKSNARVIGKTANNTGLVLARCPADEQCVIPQGVVRTLQNDTKQIAERASALCITSDGTAEECGQRDSAPR